MSMVWLAQDRVFIITPHVYFLAIYGIVLIVTVNLMPTAVSTSSIFNNNSTIMGSSGNGRSNRQVL